MKELGRITQIKDLRSIWTHEAHDFSMWLSKEENLAQLSESIGIDITLEERESCVGNFNVDLYATEEGTGRKIIIENQLEDTNHDHLGKIITYASGKEASVIVWIVKRARDEHIQAIDWLNLHTDQEIGFFLIEIVLLQIGDSLPAPQFNVVSKPNDWTKNLKSAEGLSDTKKLQLEFWQSFAENAFSQDVFSKQFGKRKARPQHWYDLSLGSSSANIALTVNTQKKLLGAEINVRDDKELFYHFKEMEGEIQEKVGHKAKWIEATKACRILFSLQGDIMKNKDNWNDYYIWFCDMALKLKEVFQKYNWETN